MKMSKKICSLLLVLCVLCTAVPAFARTEVVNNGLLPEAGITMENIDMIIGWQVFVEPSDATVKAAMEDSAFVSRCTTEGSFTIAERTFIFTATSFAGNDGGPYMYVTSVLGNSADLKAAIEAAKTTVAGMELNPDGTACVTGNEGKRNVKRYLMTLLGEDYSGLNNEDLVNHNVLVKANVTVKDKRAGTQEVEVGNIPEGTIYLSSNVITNDIPSNWKTVNGIYQQNDALGSSDSGVDGSWAVFTAPATGTYNVWATKRDRTMKSQTEADTDGNQRDIFMDVSGTKLSFVRATKEDGSTYAPTNMTYYWEPELYGTTVTFAKGQQVYVRLLSGTGNFAGSYGFIFVPADQNVEPNNKMFGGTISGSYDDKGPIATNFATLTVKSTAPHSGSALVSKNVTVNGAAVTATERTAFAKFPRVRQYDMNGNYLAAATVMDAVVAADAADNTYDLTTKDAKSATADLLNGLTITVNGAACANPDRIAVNDGDVITVESFAVDKTNFAPFLATSIGINANGGIDKSNNDALAFKGLIGNATMKLITSGAVNANGWAATSLNMEDDILRDCYLNGYITVGKDVKATTGDDRLVTIFVKDLPIIHSAFRTGITDADFKATNDNRLELGIMPGNTDNITFIDGSTYVSPIFPAGGGLQDPTKYGYDLSHLYITNTRSAADTKVTAAKTADGVYKLTSNKSLAVVLYRVAKNASGAITGVTTEYKILDFMGDGEAVRVGDNETVYVWEGSFMKDASSASLKPLCAPLTK